MNSIIQLSKNMGMKHNVSFRVIDSRTNQVVARHEGHNAATNSMLLGIAHYLTGDGIYDQARSLLIDYVPKFISLGTMGLFSQDEDINHLPTGIGVSSQDSEEIRFNDYMKQVPGFGADGYSEYKNNNRTEFGLGPMFEHRLGGKQLPGTYEIKNVTRTCGRMCLADGICEKCSYYHIQTTKQYVPDTRKSVCCELISKSLGVTRSPISYREVVPEKNAELEETVDVVFSGMISTGALAKFREPGKDYIFITEAGLWGQREWRSGGENGLLAAYRIAPPDSNNWDMEVPSNRDILKANILRVGKNEVVQVIWKIQIGSLDQLSSTISRSVEKLKWIMWEPPVEENKEEVTNG